MTEHRTGTPDEWRAARLDLLDRAPLGRNEGDMSWFHRHDQYEDSSAHL